MTTGKATQRGGRISSA